jgi:UDP-4-amino-4-deoxy-L-arabinose formyltransferase/UDP-glucuronic acid dehydrogenase (UDP-4-keto-hexauronic acid decarboxylating)
MRICVIGRTNWLLEAARRAVHAGHVVGAVITAKGSPESTAQAEDFERFAAECGAPVFRSVDSTRQDILQYLSENPCDLALTMNFPGIIRSRFLALFPHGVFNCHGSLLPRNRGNACPNWSILNGDEETGLTLHRIDSEELDTGPIALQRPFSLAGGGSIGDVYAWYDEAIPEAFSSLLEKFERGDVLLQAQDESIATYCYPRRPSDGHVDFRSPTAEILRLVRASGRPFEGAYALLEGATRVSFFAARDAKPAQRIFAVPGQVLEFSPGKILSVRTGDGAVDITDFVSESDLSNVGRRSRFVI